MEKQVLIDDEILKNISLALDLPITFFKNTNLEEFVQNVVNNATQNSATDSHDSIYQGKENKVNYTLGGDLAKDFMQMQKDHYEKELKRVEELGRLKATNEFLLKEIEELKKK